MTHETKITTVISLMFICIMAMLVAPLLVLIWKANTPQQLPEVSQPVPIVQIVPNEYVGVFYTGGETIEVRKVNVNGSKFVTFYDIDHNKLQIIGE